MILTLTTELKDLKGDPIKTGEPDALISVTLGKALANIVLSIKGDPIRSYAMASDMFTKDEITLNKADLEWIRKGVTDFGTLVYNNALIPGQILMLLNQSPIESE